MIQITEKYNCTGCHACAVSCPKNCISMTADEEGFLYPRVNQAECIQCGKCQKVCPLINHNTRNPEALQIGYASYHKNEQIRLNSSSGGIFTLLAEYILHEGGIVVGAALSEDCKSVHHIIAETIEDLQKLRGSKYVQSTIGDTYKTVKQMLDDGKPVLFTGTPCQIGGLFSYLGKEYANLYTQDFICHGVPSPMVWKQYVELREKAAGASVQKISFRNKKFGWKNYSVAFEFSNATKYLKNFRTDTFMQGFLADIYLRPSCHQCAFKTTERQADITLADFWGVQNILHELDDDKGISFVWIHSDKGMKLFHDISEYLVSRKIEVSDALKSNRAALSSPSASVNRKKFFENLHHEDLEQNIKEYSKKPLSKRIRHFLGKVKRKLLKG